MSGQFVISPLPLQPSDPGQRIELEYGWEILVDPTGRLQREQAGQQAGWRPARVGLSWNVQFDDLRDYMGAAWYRTSFDLPAFTGTRHVLLKFGAVDYFAEVFVNGLSIGTHEGGYTPFSFEVTHAIHPGTNELVIRVIDPPMDEAQNRALFPDMMYNEIPHGKQNWYVQNSGIWQGVRLEVCPALFIERLDVTPGAAGRFAVDARMAGVGLTAEGGALVDATTINVSIFDANGRRVFQASEPIANRQTVRVSGVIPHARMWSPDDPALYNVEVTLDGPVRYHRRTRFGFRSFESRQGKLFLNDKPFYMIAALDQDFYPETVHTPTSVELVRDMMTKAKRLGINVLRCHLKVAHPVYLDVADEVGMLVWTELPSWSDCWFPSDHFSMMAAIRAEKMFHEILIRDWNHPCIVIQTIINESWGVNLKNPAQRAWLAETFDRIKALLAPLGRLVVDNSACEGNFHIKTDLEDFHQYYSMPDQAERWDKWLADLASRPDWTFSPFGDAQRAGNEPIIVSEFGNWGLPKLPDQLPWWFEVSFGGREVTRPAGVLERFRAYGFDKLFGSFNQLAEATQWHQFVSLKHEIESIRSYESIQGYVVTGITDVHWEVNGLLDMWRNEKVYARALSQLQQPDLLMCSLPRHSFFAGERVELRTVLSHYSDRDLAGARVRWSTSSGESGRFMVPTGVQPGTTVALEMVSFRLPDVLSPTIETLDLEIRLADGQRWTENSYNLFVLPVPVTPVDARASVRVAGHPHMQELQEGLRQAGYEVHGELTPEVVLISPVYDNTVAAHLSQGGRALLLVDSDEALPSAVGISVKVRAGSELEGRWFSNFNWIRSDNHAFSALAFTPILGFESEHVTPNYVLQGIPPDQFEDVLSGATYGWLNLNSALAVQFRAGRGRLVVTTFRFHHYGSDPYATQLLNAFLRYLAGSACDPAAELPLVTTVVQ
jgi:hypothetical protein